MNVRENRRGNRRIENPVPLAILGTRHRTKTNKTHKKNKKQKTKNKKQQHTEQHREPKKDEQHRPHQHPGVNTGALEA
jgi:hypothetical protein